MQKYLIHIKRITQIAIPIIIVEAGHQLTHILNTIMVGKLGAIYIAASSLASYLFMIPLLFALGSTMAITPLAGNAFGANNIPECKRLFSNAIFVQILNGIFITIITLSIGFIIPLIDPDAQKTALAHNYYNYLALSSLPIVLLFTFKGYLDAFRYTIYGMFAVLFGNVLTICLNWILIYGNLGFPALELEGAGIGTLLSRITTLIFIIIIATITPKTRKLLIIPKFSHIQKNKVKEFLKYGLHIGTQSSVEIASFTLIVIFAGWLGTQSAAAYQICINIAGLCFLSTMGISTAATVLISNYKGANDIQGIKEASKTIFVLTFLFTFVFSIILLAGSSLFPSLFIEEQDVVKLASILLFMLAFFQIPDGLNVVVAGILRGLLDTKIPMIFYSIIFWGIMIPLAYILAFILKLEIIGIMYAVCIGIFLSATFIIIRFIYILKKLQNNK